MTAWRRPGCVLRLVEGALAGRERQPAVQDQADDQDQGQGHHDDEGGDLPVVPAEPPACPHAAPSPEAGRAGLAVPDRVERSGLLNPRASPR